MLRSFNVVMVYSADRSALLMCRRTKEPYLELYNLVGGKIEPGEDGLQSAYRELSEETGIASQDIVLRHLMDFTYPLDDCEVKVYVGWLTHAVDLVEEANPLLWMPFAGNDFFDMKRFAGEGNIGHMVEHVRMHSAHFFPEDEG